MSRAGASVSSSFLGVLVGGALACGRAGGCSLCGCGVVCRGGECPAAAGFFLVVLSCVCVVAGAPFLSRGLFASVVGWRTVCMCERVVVGCVPLRSWVGASFVAWCGFSVGLLLWRTVLPGYLCGNVFL